MMQRLRSLKAWQIASIAGLSFPQFYVLYRGIPMFKEQREAKFKDMETTGEAKVRARDENVEDKKLKANQRKANQDAVELLVGEVDGERAYVMLPAELCTEEDLDDVRGILGGDGVAEVYTVSTKKFKGSIAGGSESAFEMFKYAVESLEKKKVVVRNQLGDLKAFDLDIPGDRAKFQRFVHKPETLNEESYSKTVSSLMDSDIFIYTYIPEDSFISNLHKHPDYILKKPDISQVESAFHELSYEHAHRNSKYGIIRDPNLAAKLGIGRQSSLNTNTDIGDVYYIERESIYRGVYSNDNRDGKGSLATGRISKFNLAVKQNAEWLNGIARSIFKRVHVVKSQFDTDMLESVVYGYDRFGGTQMY